MYPVLIALVLIAPALENIARAVGYWSPAPCLGTTMLWGPMLWGRRRIEVYFRGIFIGILRGPGHGNIGILGGVRNIRVYLCFFVFLLKKRVFSSKMSFGRRKRVFELKTVFF